MRVSPLQVADLHGHVVEIVAGEAKFGEGENLTHTFRENTQTVVRQVQALQLREPKDQESRISHIPPHFSFCIYSFDRCSCSTSGRKVYRRLFYPILCQRRDTFLRKCPVSVSVLLMNSKNKMRQSKCKAA